MCDDPDTCVGIEMNLLVLLLDAYLCAMAPTCARLNEAMATIRGDYCEHPFLCGNTDIRDTE